MHVRQIAAVALVWLSAGCGLAQSVVPEPERITLQDALVGTVQALNAAYREARKPGNVVMGYYPCTVTASYDISAAGTTSNKLALGVAGGPSSGIAVSASGSHEEALTGARGNSIQVVFASSLCLPAGSSAAPAPAAAMATHARHGEAASGRAAGAAEGSPGGEALPPPPPVFAAPMPPLPMMLRAR